MATQLPCKKNDTGGYTFYISLVSQANTKVMQANPTLAAGDFKIAIDDGAPANLNTLPAVDADYTRRVKVVLSQAETNGDNLTIIGSDAAGAEWCDITINIQTAARQFDDHAFPLTSGRGILLDSNGVGNSNELRRATADTTTGVGTEIKLDASANASNDFYNNTYIHILSGTGAGQARFISDYVGATKVATVDRAWTTNPTNDSVFVIFPFGSLPGASAPTAAEVADQVWDEARAGHVSAGSFGEYVLADTVRISGTAGIADTLETIFGTITTAAHFGIIDTGTAQAATATTIQLRAAFSANDDTMIGATVHVYSSTNGKYQSRVILDWDSATDTATVDTWTETPTGTILYVVFATAPASSTSPIPVNVTKWSGTNVASPDTAGYPVVTIKDGTGQGELLTTSGLADVNVVQVSSDETAADNLEAMFDGTGYAGGTIKLTVDAVAISGDSTAADNAEAFFDGTGYAGTNNVIPTVTSVTTVAGLANNSVTAAALAADAVTEIQSGLATAAALATVDTVVDAILADTGTDGVIVATNNDKTGYRLSATGVDDVHDEVVEGATTLRQLTRGFAAVLLGKASGLDTATAIYRDIGDSKDRVTATVDADGNRTAVTRDLT